jgi:hypothetical protein
MNDYDYLIRLAKWNDHKRFENSDYLWRKPEILLQKEDNKYKI